ncbi:MAG: alpha/beta hydrolase [Lachnospiraceae bacterium]|nr:alpha/beta hydrolase [Lachnospiraceae bacterium]
MPYFNYKNKRCFYKEYGQGQPLIFLHGNTASSNMFEVLMPLYTTNFRCILIDFLGNGQSDRIKKFSPDMWYDEALQTIALIEHLNCGKVNLIGTSGGAWVAVNAALERPDFMHRIVADSFDGRTLHDNFSDNLLLERTMAKNDLQLRQFYEWCQGKDWEKVVDLDTEALLQCAREKRPLFHKSLKELKVPTLLVGSKKDEMCRPNLEEEYRQMSTVIPNAKVYIFDQGGHPAVLTNADEFSQLIRKFLSADSTWANTI